MTNLKTIAVAVAALVVFNSYNSNAQTAIKASYSINTVAEPLSVKYLGCDENYLLFQVAVQSENNASLLEIEDAKEGALYSSTINKTQLVKTLKIEKKDDQELNFKLLINKKIYSKSFSVSTSQVNHTTVSENDITKL